MSQVLREFLDDKRITEPQRESAGEALVEAQRTIGAPRAHKSALSISLPAEGYCRLSSIIKPHGVLPISRSRWYAGIAAGEFPKPKKVGSASLWDVADIRTVKARIDAGEFDKAVA